MSEWNRWVTSDYFEPWPGRRFEPYIDDPDWKRQRKIWRHSVGYKTKCRVIKVLKIFRKKVHENAKILG